MTRIAHDYHRRDPWQPGPLSRAQLVAASVLFTVAFLFLVALFVRVGAS